MSALEEYREHRAGAEARCEGIVNAFTADAMRDELLARIAELEATIERLKVCGSCEHCNPKGPWCREASGLWNHESAGAGWNWLLTDGSIDDRVLLEHHCHFDPSRWKEH